MLKDCERCQGYKAHNGYNCGFVNKNSEFIRTKDFTVLTIADFESVKKRPFGGETCGEFFDRYAKLCGFKTAFDGWANYLKLQCPKEREKFDYDCAVELCQEEYKRRGDLWKFRGTNCSKCNNKGYIPSVNRDADDYRYYGRFTIKREPCDCVKQYYLLDSNGEFKRDYYGRIIELPANQLPKWFGGN
jgi:hypothetical protein